MWLGNHAKILEDKIQPILDKAGSPVNARVSMYSLLNPTLTIFANLAPLVSAIALPIALFGSSSAGIFQRVGNADPGEVGC